MLKNTIRLQFTTTSPVSMYESDVHCYKTYIPYNINMPSFNNYFVENLVATKSNQLLYTYLNAMVELEMSITARFSCKHIKVILRTRFIKSPLLSIYPFEASSNILRTVIEPYQDPTWYRYYVDFCHNIISVPLFQR